MDWDVIGPVKPGGPGVEEKLRDKFASEIRVCDTHSARIALTKGKLAVEANRWEKWEDTLASAR